MKRDEALRKIDALVNVLSVDIPNTLELHGKIYNIKDDIVSGERSKMIRKYQEVYDELREEISKMDDIPEELVTKALILRRAILFLKEYREENEIEDAKRWIEYIKKIK